MFAIFTMKLLQILCTFFFILLTSDGLLIKTLEKPQRPEIVCRVGRKDNFRIRLVNETRGDGQSVEAKVNDRLEFHCDAPYVTRWVVSEHFEQLLVAVPKVTRRVENNFESGPFKFHSILYFSIQKRLSGSVGCQSIQNSSLESKIHVFIPEGKFFVGGDAQIKIEEESPIELIPCPSNYQNDASDVELFQIIQDDTGDEYKRPIEGIYDPKVGFYIKENETNNETEGIFQCVAGSEKVTIEFIGQKNETIEGDVTGLTKGTTTVNEYGSPNLIWPPTGGQVICENKDHKPSRQLIQSISCESPYDCDLFRPCFTSPDDCPEKMTKGGGCHIGACAILKESQYSGLIKCTAGRNQTIEYFFTGLDRRRYTTTSAIPKRALIQMDIDNPKPVLYTNEPVFFFCQAASFLFTYDLQFAAIFKNETTSPLPNYAYKLADDDEVEDRESRGAIQQGIFVNLTKDMVAIVCMAPWYNSSEWIKSSIEFIAKDVLAPSINNSSQSGHQVFYRGESNRNLLCSVRGEPKPKITWFFNDTEINGDNNFEIIPTKEGGSYLNFPLIEDKLEGTYRCQAKNILGVTSIDFRVQIHERKVLNRGAIYGLSIGGSIGLLALTLAFVLMWRKYVITRNKLRNLTIEEIQEFVHGNPEALQINPHYGCLPAQYLPFDSKWEIPDADIKIFNDSVLGSGEFGMVVRGQLLGQPVAVKTTKAHADVSYFKALLMELKVMAYIGKHQNIVHFLGAVTSKIRERIVYVVVELSPIGSLEQYLISNRGIYDHFMMDQQAIDPKLLEKGNGMAYINFEKKVSTIDFAKWSYQIASGMEYLAHKKVIHGDLATRNVLLFTGETAKITDFGLSRQLYEHTNYIKKNEIPLPWRWMAIESLRNLEFSTKSDIWSYGITVAEIFTMAELPYAGVSWSLDFLEKLEKGLRVRKPKLATDAVYDILLKCWHPVPQCRISFEELKEFFYKMLTSDLTPQGSYVRIDHTAALPDYCL